jgi:hypothetical protein
MINETVLEIIFTDSGASPHVNQDCMLVEKSPAAAGTQAAVEKRPVALCTPADSLPPSKKIRYALTYNLVSLTCFDNLHIPFSCLRQPLAN